jgi:hypothetical protein
MRFKELPKKEHDKLVREYWKTWLAAFKFKVKNKKSFENFVQEMEALLLEHYMAGDMDCVDGVSSPDE